ncbi:membrane hypothetical protein [Candidatus Sulfopaludibacter sp. SbA4]|nr:membrane hypothetical protein [Candidatus Sulfopaludibacter sp. SbA4]
MGKFAALFLACPMKNRGLDRFDLVIGAFLVASYVAVGMMPFAPQKFGDGFFHPEAKTLAQAVRGSAPWTDVGIARAPAPVVYYAIPYLMVPPGSSENRYWQAAFIWTAAWMVVCLCLIRRIGDELGGPLTGKLSAILSLLTPFWAYYSYGINAEPPAFLGVVLFTYGWLRWQGPAQEPGRSSRWAWLAAGGLCLFVLSRPNALLLLIFALLAAARMYRIGNPDAIRAARSTVQVVAVTALIVAASYAVVRALPRYQQVDYFVWVMFPGAFQYRSEPWDWRYWDKVRRKGSADYEAWDRTYKEIGRQAKDSGVPTYDLLKKWLLRDIVHNPGAWIRMAGVRTLALHVSLVNSQRPEAFRVGPVSGWVVNLVFHVLVNAVNLLLIAGALWFLFDRRRNLASYWPLWGPWLSLLVFHAVVYAEPRYLFPSRPGITVMAAAALTPATARLCARFRDRLCARTALISGAQDRSEMMTSVSVTRNEERS